MTGIDLTRLPNKDRVPGSVASLVPNEIWVDDYPKAAQQMGIDLTLDEAVASVNSWVDDIALAD